VVCDTQPTDGPGVNPASSDHHPAAAPQHHQEVERLDVSTLGEMLRARRGKLSLRQAAADAGVSFSTFSRVESGATPDLTSFLLLCEWLGVSPAEFFRQGPSRTLTPIDQAIGHLYADPQLDPEAAKKISTVLRDMYDLLAKNKVEPPVIACHLRAASVFRPGVSERLNALLSDMHDKLAERFAVSDR
jgi:transcriptional regulator with XRE-family HTH domain